MLQSLVHVFFIQVWDGTWRFVDALGQCRHVQGEPFAQLERILVLVNFFPDFVEILRCNIETRGLQASREETYRDARQDLSPFLLLHELVHDCFWRDFLWLFHEFFLVNAVPSIVEMAMSSAYRVSNVAAGPV